MLISILTGGTTVMSRLLSTIHYLTSSSVRRYLRAREINSQTSSIRIHHDLASIREPPTLLQHNIQLPRPPHTHLHPLRLQHIFLTLRSVRTWASGGYGARGRDDALPRDWGIRVGGEEFEGWGGWDRSELEDGSIGIGMDGWMDVGGDVDIYLDRHVASGSAFR